MEELPLAIQLKLKETCPEPRCGLLGVGAA
jgi:hypothetical protein